MLTLLNDPQFLHYATIFAYFIVAVVSLIISVIILSFRGKNAMDWSLALKNLAMSLVMFRIGIVAIIEFDTSPTLRFWQWFLIGVAYLFTLYVLSKEHVFYKNKHIMKSPKIHKNPKKKTKTTN